MSTQDPKMSSDTDHTILLTGSVKDSAQQIWLAGLGAFAKAQEEGGRVFEALVKDGVAIQRKTQAAAEEKLSEATSKMTAMAGGIQSKAGQQWDKLETIFEDRVAKALHKLGVPSANEVEALTARIDELSEKLQKMSARVASPVSAAARKSVKPAAKPRAAVRRSPTRKPE